MQSVLVSEGEPVYVRAYSTQRAAIAEVINLVDEAGSTWGQVRLITALHDWDNLPPSAGPVPTEGEVLLVEGFRLEPIRH